MFEFINVGLAFALGMGSYGYLKGRIQEAASDDEPKNKGEVSSVIFGIVMAYLWLHGVGIV